MTARGWVLFAAMSLIWGIPYLLIKVAVKHVAPPVIVFGRTSLSSAILLVIASRSGAVRAALRHWRPVLAFAALEMAGPWLLLTNAERRLPSGLTGLLVACVPIVGAIAAYLLGDRHALHPVRIVGIAIGLGGVALIVGRDLGGSGGVPWLSVAQVLLVCVGYATAPFIVARRLGAVPTLGVVAVSVTAVALLTAPLAWVARPDHTPPASTWWAIAGPCGDLHICRIRHVLRVDQRGRACTRDTDHVRQPRGRRDRRRRVPRRARHGLHDRRLRARAHGLLVGHASGAGDDGSGVRTLIACLSAITEMGRSPWHRARRRRITSALDGSPRT